MEVQLHNTELLLHIDAFAEGKKHLSTNRLACFFGSPDIRLVFKTIETEFIQFAICLFMYQTFGLLEGPS